MSKINRSIFVAISLTTVLIACFLLAPAAYTTLPGIAILALGGTTAILSWIDIFKISVKDGLVLSTLFLVSSIGNIICVQSHPGACLLERASKSYPKQQEKRRLINLWRKVSSPCMEPLA